MMFNLSVNDLKTLCRLNMFSVKNEDMLFFGLRGCLPLDENNFEFGTHHRLELQETNNTNPRCTIAQWKYKEDSFAVFPASTVPHKKYVSKALEKFGSGANQLMTGYYSDYRKGRHKAGSPTGHDAFKQTAGRPVRRTADDFDYDNDDRVEFSNPNDNMHAGWCQSINSDSYASAGCQVIVGYPRCDKRGDNNAAGAWKTFQENAYALTQDSFQYILLNGRDALKVVQLKNQTIAGRLRYGSSGEKVAELQNILKTMDYYEGKIDMNFGKRTLNAVMNFQTNVFGSNEDDGIIGPSTADVLNLKLHKIKILD
ncbi:MAG: peptidoglycan-binding protein [Melioribacteraceae bacterium]|nr:peptidoglycan-binding protein [Melioribacteraceae bacterium]